MAMQPKKIWANLAVSNLERTTAFYQLLGFKPNGKPNADLTSFCIGDEDFVVHFFLKEVIESNTGTVFADPAKGNEVMFTVSAESREEVHQWETEVMNAGGTIVSPPEAFGPGYYGFVFADPDGHRFNVFYM